MEEWSFLFFPCKTTLDAHKNIGQIRSWTLVVAYMNHEEDIQLIKNFLGQECERTLAINSLKIRFGENSPYIWIDPPWELRKGKELLVSSGDYPGHDADFKEWSAKLNPLNKTNLGSYEYSVKEGLILHFINGFSLHVPSKIAAMHDEDSYHHWYAAE